MASIGDRSGSRGPHAATRRSPTADDERTTSDRARPAARGPGTVDVATSNRAPPTIVDPPEHQVAAVGERGQGHRQRHVRCSPAQIADRRTVTERIVTVNGGRHRDAVRRRPVVRHAEHEQWPTGPPARPTRSARSVRREPPPRALQSCSAAAVPEQLASATQGSRARQAASAPVAGRRAHPHHARAASGGDTAGRTRRPGCGDRRSPCDRSGRSRPTPPGVPQIETVTTPAGQPVSVTVTGAHRQRWGAPRRSDCRPGEVLGTPRPETPRPRRRTRDRHEQRRKRQRTQPRTSPVSRRGSAPPEGPGAELEAASRTPVLRAPGPVDEPRPPAAPARHVAGADGTRSRRRPPGRGTPTGWPRRRRSGDRLGAGSMVPSAENGSSVTAPDADEREHPEMWRCKGDGAAGSSSGISSGRVLPRPIPNGPLASRSGGPRAGRCRRCARCRSCRGRRRRERTGCGGTACTESTTMTVERTGHPHVDEDRLDARRARSDRSARPSVPPATRWRRRCRPRHPGLAPGGTGW